MVGNATPKPEASLGLRNIVFAIVYLLLSMRLSNSLILNIQQPIAAYYLASYCVIFGPWGFFLGLHAIGRIVANILICILPSSLLSCGFRGYVKQCDTRRLSCRCDSCLDCHPMSTPFAPAVVENQSLEEFACCEPFLRTKCRWGVD
jgi:hypothetical protein